MGSTIYANSILLPSNPAKFITASQPFGTSKYTFMLMNMYDVYLWTDAKEWSYNTTFALHIEYNKNFSSKALSERSIYEIRRYYDINEEQAENYLEQLLAIFPDVTPNDNIVALFRPGKKLTFYHNNTPVGAITDMTFAQQFLDIWLHHNNHHKTIQCQLTTGTQC